LKFSSKPDFSDNCIDCKHVANNNAIKCTSDFSKKK